MNILLILVRSTEESFQKIKNALRRMPRYNYFPSIPKIQRIRNRTLNHWSYDSLGVSPEQFEFLLEVVQKSLSQRRGNVEAHSQMAETIPGLFFFFFFLTWSPRRGWDQCFNNKTQKNCKEDGVRF